MAAAGHAPLIAETADRYGDLAREAVDEILAIDPLQTGLPKRPPVVADYLRLEYFSPPLLAGGQMRLSTEAVGHLATMLAFTPVDPPYAGVQVVRDALDTESVAEFLWEALGAWVREGGEAKQEWVLLALAHFGNDDIVRRLTPLIRRWPGERANKRAVKALDVLTAIGTDVAMMSLYGIAQNVKFTALQKTAQEKVHDIARKRELTVDELADRLVPFLGLDPDGGMSLDFGPRRFRVGFDAKLRPFVEDEDGKRLAKGSTRIKSVK